MCAGDVDACVPEGFYDGESDEVDELRHFLAEHRAGETAFLDDVELPSSDTIELWSPSADKRLRANEKEMALHLGYHLLLEITARVLPMRCLRTVRRYVRVAKLCICL